MTTSVTSSRVRAVNDQAENPGGDYVLYWMIGARRVRYNFGLQHAADRAEQLGVPLLVVEPLRVDYPWASERVHRFVIDGMRDTERALAGGPVRYYPYVEPRAGAAKGLLAALGRRAALVVSDDTPVFFLPAMIAAAARVVPVRMDVVDSNGLYPLRATERVFTTAASFRRHLQKHLPEHLSDLPQKNPLSRRALDAGAAIARDTTTRWAPAQLDRARELHSLSVDHSVRPTATRGGAKAAGAALRGFLRDRFDDYATRRNHPRDDCQSHLAPYLHFGHMSAHEVFLTIASREDWSPAQLADRATGSRAGWWGASEPAEAFFDQLVTWRELGYNMATHDRGYRRYESLPGWARATLEAHAGDPRPYIYSAAELEAAATHDPLWNAAQNQLVTEGTIHNYLRMLWGKKILEWTPDPRTALDVMIELNNKYALDGRDPNSYSGIFWVLGRYDRAWGPERPVFGKVRYMTSASTARKIDVRAYVARYSPAE